MGPHGRSRSARACACPRTAEAALAQPHTLTRFCTRSRRSGFELPSGPPAVAPKGVRQRHHRVGGTRFEPVLRPKPQSVPSRAPAPPALHRPSVASRPAHTWKPRAPDFRALLHRRVRRARPPFPTTSARSFHGLWVLSRVLPLAVPGSFAGLGRHAPRRAGSAHRPPPPPKRRTATSGAHRPHSRSRAETRSRPREVWTRRPEVAISACRIARPPAVRRPQCPSFAANAPAGAKPNHARHRRPARPAPHSEECRPCHARPCCRALPIRPAAAACAIHPPRPMSDSSLPPLRVPPDLIRGPRRTSRRASNKPPCAGQARRSRRPPQPNTLVTSARASRAPEGTRPARSRVLWAPEAPHPASPLRLGDPKATSTNGFRRVRLLSPTPCPSARDPCGSQPDAPQDHEWSGFAP
jgi:hypothetical protein